MGKPAPVNAVMNPVAGPETFASIQRSAVLFSFSIGVVRSSSNAAPLPLASVASVANTPMVSNSHESAWSQFIFDHRSATYATGQPLAETLRVRGQADLLAHRPAIVVV